MCELYARASDHKADFLSKKFTSNIGDTGFGEFDSFLKRIMPRDHIGIT